MVKSLWKRLRDGALGGTALLAVAGIVDAQTLPPIAPPPQFQPKAVQASALTPTSSTDDLKARIERLEQQNLELMNALKSLGKAPASPVSTEPGGVLNKSEVQKIVSDYIGAREEQIQAGEAAMKSAADAKGFTVGQNTGLAGSWSNHQPWFESSDKAFRIHVGGRIQPEWIFGAGQDAGVANGRGGTGQLLEGANFRRARIEVDGWLHEVIDFFIEYDFANQFSSGQPFTANPATGAVTPGPNTDANTFGVPAPTDLWAGINHIPVIGGLRIGNLKPAIGLDHLISSRYLDFLERSSGFDTYFARNNGFAPGFQIFNLSENERLSWQLTATKPNNTLFGWTRGGGEWDYAGRITGLPWYEDNGRRMIHVGIGAKYIDRLDDGLANFNTRWLLRQGGPNLQNTVAQVRAFGVSQAMVNPEFFMNLGPLSIQAEYIYSQVNGVSSFTTQVTGGTPVATSQRNFRSQTAYVQAMYFLTGESRPYAKSALHGSGAAPTRVVPFRNYFWVPGEGGGGNPFSAGAWQVGARYCWSDFNDNEINGGTIHEVTLGLNWFLNPNMKIQWNYDIGHRSIPAGTSDGYYYGFGMRMAFDF